MKIYLFLQGSEPESVTHAPAAIVVSKSEPYIWAPWTDITRARKAYGRQCLPKLKRELSSKHTLTVCQALCTLSDLLHDPEVTSEAFSINLQARFVKLLLNPNPFIKQRTLLCLMILANQALGPSKLTQNKYLLRNLRTCLLEESYVIKNQAIMTVHAFLFNTLALNVFIEEDYVRSIVQCLLIYLEDKTHEFYDEQYMVLLLECLSNLVLDSDDAKIQAMAYDVFLIIDLLIHRSYKVKNAAARLFSELFKHEIGRLASYHWPFFDYLTRGFNIEKPHQNLGLLTSLRFATVATFNRQLAISSELINHLVHLVVTTSDPEILLSITQILTNIAEYPKGREILRGIGPKLIFSFPSKEENLKRNVIVLFDTINKPL
ncbi:uncharacterized protein isoform X2 [Rhodnius prolixus]|uniref:uncharacterized protein isoform X2 n=1 Tax=Rhodnius prolixus TaxID=13249 RepID=UPI003D18F6D0